MCVLPTELAAPTVRVYPLLNVLRAFRREMACPIAYEARSEGDRVIWVDSGFAFGEGVLFRATSIIQVNFATRRGI
jgi:hypothetical protein